MSKEEFAKIVDRIKKLMAKANGNTTEAEAASCISKAQEMMTKYNIENVDLVKDDISDIVEIDIEISSKFQTPALNLCVFIGRAFNIKPILVKNKTGFHKVDSKIRFIGDKNDLAIGTYVFSYVMNLSDVKSKAYFEDKIRYTQAKWSPLGAKKVKTDYQFGFVTSVCDKLKTIQKDREVANPYETQVTNALVVVKNALINKYVEETQGKLSNGKANTVKYNANHFGAGQEAGTHCGIHRGVAGNTNNQIQIGGK